MRIFLTGASGYLGLHLLGALLDAGHQVTALVRSPARLGAFASHKRVSVHRADLLEHERVSDAIRGHETCVHAALIWGAPGTELDLLDTVAAARLFDAAGRAGVRLAVLISSTAVHRPFRALMSEADPLTTTDIYGATKAAAERFLSAACATHGMRGAALRAGPIVGPPALPSGAFRSSRRLEKMVASARRGEALHVIRGRGRQFVSAAHVALAVIALIEAPQASGAHLCVARDVTTWESIARQTIAATGSSSAVIVSNDPDPSPPPRFDDGRLTALMGEPLDARLAMTRHLTHLARLT